MELNHINKAQPGGDRSAKARSGVGGIAFPGSLHAVTAALSKAPRAIRHARLIRRQAYGAYDPKEGKSRLPGPQIVQIQTVDRCNGSCPMCPYSTIDKPGPSHLMEPDLYLRILECLQRAGNTQSLYLMLQNEPLLDPGLAQRVRQARERLGKGTLIRIVTNGSQLAPPRIDELCQAGVDEIAVSIDAFREETYAAIRPGLSFSRVVDNTRALIDRGKGIKVVVRFLTMSANAAEQDQFVRYWEAHGANVELMTLNNRAGGLSDFEKIRAPRPGGKWWRRMHRLIAGRIPCEAGPLRSMSMAWDGRVLLCCHDWAARAVLGNLSYQSLAEVWHGSQANHYRSLLASCQFERSPVCRECSCTA